MEILSEIKPVDTSNDLIYALIVVLSIFTVVYCLYKMHCVESDKVVYVLAIIAKASALVFGFFLIILLMDIFGTVKTTRYNIRVNSNITVSELVESYKVISYDDETDTWIVEKKND